MRPARLLPGERRAGDEPRERVGIGEQRLQRRGRAPRTGEAPHGIPGRRGRWREAPLGDRRGVAGGGLGCRGDCSASAEHEALGERVRREPVGAVYAGARALTHRVEPRKRGPSVQVADDAAHQIVGGRGDRDELSLGIEPGVATSVEDVREAIRLDRANVEQHVVGAVCVHAIEDRGGHLVARGELVGEPPAGCVQERPALPSKRLGQQGAVVLPGQGQGGGVELAELQIRQVGPGGVGEHGTGPDRAPGIGRAAPERRPAPGGQHRGPRLDAAALRDHPGAASAVAP